MEEVTFVKTGKQGKKKSKQKKHSADEDIVNYDESKDLEVKGLS